MWQIRKHLESVLSDANSTLPVHARLPEPRGVIPLRDRSQLKLWHARDPNSDIYFRPKRGGPSSDLIHEKKVSKAIGHAEPVLSQWVKSLLAGAPYWANENASRGDFLGRIRDWFCC